MSKNPKSDQWPDIDGFDRVIIAIERNLDDLVQRLRPELTKDKKTGTVGSTAKLVLIGLVRRAGNDDHVYAGWEHLSAFASVKRDAISAALTALEAGGLVRAEKRPGKTTIHHLDWDEIQALPTTKMVADGRRKIADDQSGNPTGQANRQPSAEPTSRVSRPVGKPDYTRRETRLHPSGNPTTPVGKPDTIDPTHRVPERERPGGCGGESSRGAVGEGAESEGRPAEPLADLDRRLSATGIEDADDRRIIRETRRGNPSEAQLLDLLLAIGFGESLAVDVIRYFTSARIVAINAALLKRLEGQGKMQDYLAQFRSYLRGGKSRGVQPEDVRGKQVQADRDGFNELMVALKSGRSIGAA